MRRNEKNKGPIRLTSLRRPAKPRRVESDALPTLVALPEEALPGRLLVLVSQLHRREEADSGDGRS